MRERILEATAVMLVAQGTEASMASIARQAGVATGSLYNHFANKEVLIRAVYDDLGAVIDLHLRAGDDPAASDLDRLERYIDNQISFFWDDPARTNLFEYLSNAPLMPGAEMVDSFAHTTAFIRDLLQNLQDAGWVRAGDVGLMGGFIGGAIRTTIKWQRAVGAPLTPADRLQMRQMCLAAVRQRQ